VLLVSTRADLAGEELCYSYGSDLSSADCLDRFGFVDEIEFMENALPRVLHHERAAVPLEGRPHDHIYQRKLMLAP
jgi:hypothetical protein